MVQSRYIRVVSVWVHPGQERAFEAFERDATKIMARHGGRIDSAFRCVVIKGQPADAGPFELHIVSFPDRESADSYASDPETAALGQRRAGIVSKTAVMEVSEVGPY